MANTPYYLDTEFNGFGGELISLALVHQNGESLYLINDRTWTSDEADPWVWTNVFPILHDCPVKGVALPIAKWGRLISDFISRPGETPQIIADWPDDIRYLCELLITGPGRMVTTPDQVHFSIVREDAYPTTLQGAVQHNAYWDAMALRHLIHLN